MNVIDSLTNPFGPLAKVELCGHPFHGLVTAPAYEFNGTGTLARGAGIVMDYRMPRSADAWVVQLAGVPSVVRDSGQAAADAAAGYTWLSQIVVSGTGQVWGKDPGSNSPCWYWRDAAGKVWRITVQNTGYDLADEVVVEVRPFGRVGVPAVAPRSHTLAQALDVPSALRTEYFGGGATYGILPRLHDIRSDGSGAILSVTGFETGELFADTNPALKEPTPFAFFEITVATGGDGWPVPSLTTLRTCVQTLGTISSTVDVVSTSAPITIAGTGQVISAGTVSSDIDESVTDRIISMFYAAGVPTAVTLTWSQSGTENVTQVATDEGGGSWTQTTTTVTDISYGFTGAIGAATFVNWSGSRSVTAVDARESGVDDPFGFPGGFAPTLTSTEAPFIAYLLPRGRIFATSPSPSQVQPRTYTARVFGHMWREGLTGSDPWNYGPVSYPGGTASGGASTPYGTVHPPIYRSFNPITGVLSARSDRPVCYV